MVTFLTLFFGLTIGPQRVEVAVDHRVATVELRLDGVLIAILRDAPFAIECDFGAALVPHHLEAIARDRDGEELDREVQRVNLPRQAAEAALRLLGGAGGYHGAELWWKAVDESDPEEILVFFDGQPLPVAGKRVTLPPHDPQAVHILAAELVFARQVRARAELAFGGEYGEEVSTELTAVALELHDSRKLPPAASLEGWLRVAGRPARVVAVERGPREVIVVREEASLVELRSLGRRAGGSGSRRGQSTQQRMSAGIDARDTLRLVETRPAMIRTQEGGWAALFTVTPNLNRPTTGLGWTLTNLFFAGDERARLEERVAEAVGIAGLHAASSNRVRGVLLVRAGDTGDPPPATELLPQNVRGFLRELRVPFFYWRLGPSRQPDADPWGEPTTIRGWGGVHQAVGEMMEALRPQFVVWIEGLHRPGEIELASNAPPGLRIAGDVSATRVATVSAAGSRRSRRASPGAAG